MKTHIWDRNAILAMAVYFVQGAVAVSGLAEFLLTRNAFHFTWIEISLLAALSVLTWSIKPIYGFLTDLLPLFGSRRKNYLIIASLLPVLGYGYLTLFGTSFLPIAVALIVANIGLGFADVIVDGLIVERSTPKTVGWYQAICWRSKGVGIFFAALFSGILLERTVFSSLLQNTALPDFLMSHFPLAFPEGLVVAGLNMLDIRAIFFITALLPLGTFIFSLFLDEDRAPSALVEKGRREIPKTYLISALLAFIMTATVLIGLYSLKTPLLSFIANDALSSLSIVLIWILWIAFYAMHLVREKMASMTLLYSALFLFLWQFTPSFGAPWSNYYLNTLKLSQEKLGLLSSLQPLAWVIGSFIYVRFLDRLPMKKVLLGTVLIASFLSLSQLAVATPEIGNQIGAVSLIKYLASAVLFPSYFLVYGLGAFHEVMNQSAILNLDAVLTFFLHIMYIVSFLPLLKLAALVTPKGVEATNFAVLMSVMNLGTAFGAVSGGIIYASIEGSYSWIGISFNSLHVTVVIGALSSLVCLLVLPQLKLKEELMLTTNI